MQTYLHTSMQIYFIGVGVLWDVYSEYFTIDFLFTDILFLIERERTHNGELVINLIEHCSFFPESKYITISMCKGYIINVEQW